MSAFRSYETEKAFGKSISNEGIGIFQGKVTRAWPITDRLGFLQEIGQRWPLTVLPSWPLTSHSDRSYTFNTVVSESVARSCRRGPLTREARREEILDADASEHFCPDAIGDAVDDLCAVV